MHFRCTLVQTPVPRGSCRQEGGFGAFCLQNAPVSKMNALMEIMAMWLYAPANQ